ncbi:MAG: ATP-binding cassette domain-containing protein [Bdellovibrionota bacterium]
MSKTVSVGFKKQDDEQGGRKQREKVIRAAHGQEPRGLSEHSPERRLGMAEAIRIVGATAHNLKQLSCELPAGALILVTGPSGSGKSSLIFETLYREAVRQVVAPALASPRLLLKQAEVQRVSGLSFPVLFLTAPRNRSLLPSAALLSGCYSALIELFLLEGRPACLSCGAELRAESRAQMLSWIAALPKERSVELIAPISASSPQELQSRAAEFLSAGFSRMAVDGQTMTIENVQRLADDIFPSSVPDLGIVVDLVPLSAKRAEARIASALALALKAGGGEVRVRNEGEEKLFSETLFCRKCGLRQRAVSTKDFIHTRKAGACVECSGAGAVFAGHEAGIIDQSRPLLAGGIIPWRVSGIKPKAEEEDKIARALKLTPETRWDDLSAAAQKRLLFGIAGERTFHRFGARSSVESESVIQAGVCGALFHRALNVKSERYDALLERSFFEIVCPACAGARVPPEAAARRLGALSFGAFYTGSFVAADRALSEREQTPAVVAVRSALRPVLELGIGYLELSRAAPKLSSGELQRIQLARELRSPLEKLMFFFDEPSRGLHPLEIELVSHAFRQLSRRESTVIVVDHDPQLIRSADHVLQLGPGAGAAGGRIVAQGSPSDVNGAVGEGGGSSSERPTRDALQVVEARGLHAHNLKNIDLSLRLGALTAVCGRSGSGKSTALLTCLAPALDSLLRRRGRRDDVIPALSGEERNIYGLRDLIGWTSLRRVVVTSALNSARTSRSTVGSTTGIVALLRELYARATEAKIFGLSPASFSSGSVYAERVAFKGVSFSAACSFNIVQALAHFGKVPQIARRLRLLVDLGLDYLSLAQPTRTLSSGEQQRLRLFADLVGSSGADATLYIFDEPTRGIDREQISNLIGIARGLCESGHTVVMIEHNLQVIRECDYVVELGPGGGDAGGTVISQGTPSEIRSAKDSLIGRFL